MSKKRSDDLVDGFFLSEKDLTKSRNKPRNSRLRIPDSFRGKQ
jgi:hypothetical protein